MPDALRMAFLFGMSDISRMRSRYAQRKAAGTRSGCSACRCDKTHSFALLVFANQHIGFVRTLYSVWPNPCLHKHPFKLHKKQTLFLRKNECQFSQNAHASLHLLTGLPHAFTFRVPSPFLGTGWTPRVALWFLSSAIGTEAGFRRGSCISVVCQILLVVALSYLHQCRPFLGNFDSFQVSND